MKRFLRPIGLKKYAEIDGLYAVGNFENGFISTVEQLEKWEDRIPCKNCKKAYNLCKWHDSSSCEIYVMWENNHPFRRIEKGENMVQKKVEINCDWFSGIRKLDGKLAKTNGWYGVDLDGTLAKYDGFKGDDSIGQPVPRMYRRVKNWLKNGERVKIFTARVCNGLYAIECIRDWLEENNFPRDLEITNVKDFECLEIWDDRAVQVVHNEGIPVGSIRKIKQKKT